MDVSVLVTDGGPHPPDKWASVVGARIADLVQIEVASDTEAAALARKAKPRFSLDVCDAVEAFFSDVMAAEVAAVDDGSVAARHSPFSIDAFLGPATAAVVAAAGGTPFAGHFALPEVQDAVRNILKQYFIEAANIQRSWAFDAKGL